MKRLLYGIGGAFLLASVAGASLMWPSMVIWVAWMIVALFIFSSYLLGDDVAAITANRDKWRTLAQKSEAERLSLERLLKANSELYELRLGRAREREAALQVEIEQPHPELAEVQEEFARLQAELTRLRAYADPRLFAAAGGVLTAWNGYGEGEVIEMAIERLREAVSRWGKALESQKDESGNEEKE